MEKQLSFSVEVHEEELEGERVFVADCIELGISDFGGSMEDALNNLKDGIKLLLEEYPEKRKLLEKENPSFVTRVFL